MTTEIDENALKILYLRGLGDSEIAVILQTDYHTLDPKLERLKNSLSPEAVQERKQNLGERRRIFLQNKITQLTSDINQLGAEFNRQVENKMRYMKELKKLT